MIATDAYKKCFRLKCELFNKILWNTLAQNHQSGKREPEKSTRTRRNWVHEKQYPVFFLVCMRWHNLIFTCKHMKTLHRAITFFSFQLMPEHIRLENNVKMGAAINRCRPRTAYIWIYVKSNIFYVYAIKWCDHDGLWRVCVAHESVIKLFDITSPRVDVNLFIILIINGIFWCGVLCATQYDE